jgi:xanthine dehydrogenase accessory factor
MTFVEDLSAMVASGEPFVSVTVVEKTGSVPAEPGAKMLVTAAGRRTGTVGGGRAEAVAIEQAIGMLGDASAPQTCFVSWNLTKDLGMSCAGIVRLFFEIYNAPRWTIAIFGAGHVANALAHVLISLDCRVLCFDTRQEWIDRLPVSPRLVATPLDTLTSAVASLPANAFVLLMTTGHEVDLEILLEIVRTRDFPYVGMIGSDTKARRMRQQLADAGIEQSKIAAVVCPIGLPFGSNHPSEIAISVAAQLLERRDAIRA